MPRSSCCSKCPKPPLKCKFPPCPCCKCKEKRARGEPDEENCGRKESKNAANKNKYFLAFVVDMISIIAFFIFATTMFWIAVSQHLFYVGVKIYKSGRNTQIVALILIGLLFLSISFKFIRRKICDRWRARKAAQPAKTPPTPPQPPAPKVNVAVAAVAVKTTDEDAKVATVAVAAANIKVAKTAKVNPTTTDVVVTDVQQKRTFSSCFRRSGATTVTRNITITISDDEAKEVFKKSKLYAIPTEMKQPPAILVYLRDVILNNMENS